MAGWAEQIFPGLQDAPRAEAGGMQQAQPSSTLRARGEVLPGFLQGLVQSLPLSAPREACPSFSFIPPFQPERDQGEARLNCALAAGSWGPLTSPQLPPAARWSTLGCFLLPSQAIFPCPLGRRSPRAHPASPARSGAAAARRWPLQKPAGAGKAGVLPLLRSCLPSLRPAILSLGGAAGGEKSQPKPFPPPPGGTAALPAPGLGAAPCSSLLQASPSAVSPGKPTF